MRPAFEPATYLDWVGDTLLPCELGNALVEAHCPGPTYESIDVSLILRYGKSYDFGGNIGGFMPPFLGDLVKQCPDL